MHSPSAILIVQVIVCGYVVRTIPVRVGVRTHKLATQKLAPAA